MSSLSRSQSNALLEAARSSALCEINTKVPSELTVGQWALESGWGVHQPGNNCFGIKSYPGCHGTQLLQTTEVIASKPVQTVGEFATFASLEACFEKHAALISEGRPYAHSWQQFVKDGNAVALIRNIAPVYATATNYADMILRIAAIPEVGAAIATARASLNKR